MAISQIDITNKYVKSFGAGYLVSYTHIYWKGNIETINTNIGNLF